MRRLLDLWKNDWPNADYLGDVLPRLLARAESGNRAERALIDEIQSVAKNEFLDAAEVIEIAGKVRLELDLAEKVIPELERDFRNFQLARAQARFTKYRDVLQEDWYERRRVERIGSRKHTVQYDISRYYFKDAKELCSDSKAVLRDDEARRLDDWFNQSIADAIAAFIDSQVMPFLRHYEFTEAREAFRPVEQYASPGTIESLLEKYREAKELTELLSNKDFLGAQELFERSHTLTTEQFSQVMGSYVNTYFASNCGFPIDEYKARAMSTTSRRTLVEARAGSGKTTLLACFVRLLEEKLGVNLDEILVMAFNRSAAYAIGKKINMLLAEERFSNARTFHSLAWHLAEGCGWTKVLSDDPKREEHEQERRRFLEDTWKDSQRSRPWLWILALLMFRKELSPQEVKLSPDSEDYYLYRRNECQTSLRGENVKSWGEKVIADFLLEHDIRYSYERSVFWDKKLYSPDFTLFDSSRRTVILEHWAIDPEDQFAQVPAHWGKSTEQYRSEIGAKRGFWSNKNIPLVETHATQVAAVDREDFERRLATRLAEAGFRIEKLSSRVIISRISDQRIRRFVRLLGQCISLAKKAGLAPEAVRARYRRSDVTDTKIRAFGSIAWRVYQAYERRMKERELTDYDTLLGLAAQRVERSFGGLVAQDRTRGQFHLSQLRWVLIDEYQDFSPLFDSLIRAIMKTNPRLRMLCVGDNWQAINGFAGSDTRFIESFEDLNSEDEPLRFAVPVNRRSGKQIVSAGNTLMKEVSGTRAIPAESANMGRLEVFHVDDIYVECRSAPAHRDTYESDAKYLVTRDREGRVSVDVLASKYLKLVAQTIESRPNLSYSVLTRTNWLSSISIGAFESRLRSCLGDDFLEEMESREGRIDVSTVHSYKGGESDVSIVLRVIDRQFPLVHPDSALLAPLGQTPERIIREERRLFYVAISRAKERLILVTERDRESLFLEEITGRSFTNNGKN